MTELERKECAKETDPDEILPDEIQTGAINERLTPFIQHSGFLLP
jgi:hypothetical protein